MKSLVRIVLVWLAVSSSSVLHGALKQYQEYKANFAPLEADASAYAAYQKVFDEKNKDSVTREQMSEAYALVEKVLQKNPDWIDGYWILGSLAFNWGGSYTDEKDLPYARSVLVKGQTVTEECIRLQPDQFLCKLFLGSTIGSIGTIDGVLSSLIKAKRVEKLWKEVVESPYNFHFFPNVSAQGGVRYGLGIFYRLIPDMILLKWIFDVRGNIKDSVQMHRDSIALDGANTCAELMLGVALTCKASGSFQEGDGREGLAILQKTAKDTAQSNLMMQICAKDAQKIMKEPSLACGYATAKQQEVSKEAVEKAQKTKP